MAFDPKCPHGMPTKASCIDCQYDGPVVDPALHVWQRAHVFNAAFMSACADCGVPLMPGETVQAWKRREGLIDEETAYTHQEGCNP